VNAVPVLVLLLLAVQKKHPGCITMCVGAIVVASSHTAQCVQVRAMPVRCMHVVVAVVLVVVAIIGCVHSQFCIYEMTIWQLCSAVSFEAQLCTARQ
jgi:hypothetical protein